MRATNSWALVLSCEHGGNRIPKTWQHLFASIQAQRDLASHRGWDPGAAQVAGQLANHLKAGPVVLATTSRLLVELNRSPGHPLLFSEYSRDLSPAQRNQILAEHYQPHRQQVRRLVQAAMATADQVLHLAVHSFTPALNPSRRNFQLGLLYDPARAAERALCADWARDLKTTGLSVRRNQPYKGAADGLCRALRRELPDPRYLGVELELNQQWLAEGADAAPMLVPFLQGLLQR